MSTLEETVGSSGIGLIVAAVVIVAGVFALRAKRRGRPTSDVGAPTSATGMQESAPLLAQTAAVAAPGGGNGQDAGRAEASVSAFVVSLARRNGGLVDQQLALLDTLELSVDDPALLANYFKLDHLATRMRRNADSLLVLAGVDRPGLRAPQDIDEVVRAGISEIEDYRRIDVLALDHVQVTGRAATTLGHLIAELLDNATSFSPPEARVRVAGNAAPGGYEIMVADSGIGISETRLDEINRKLALPPEVGAHGEATIGLAVVSMLAARIDAHVSLASGENGGTVATLHVPSSVLHSGEAPPSPSSSRSTVQPAPALPVVETSLLSMTSLPVEPTLPVSSPTVSSPVPVASLSTRPITEPRPVEHAPVSAASNADAPSPIAVEAANAIAKLTLTASGLPMRPLPMASPDDGEGAQVGVSDRGSVFWPPPSVSPAGELNSTPAAVTTAFGSMQVAESTEPRPIVEPYPDRIGAAMASFARQRPTFDNPDSNDRASL